MCSCDNGVCFHDGRVAGRLPAAVTLIVAGTLDGASFHCLRRRGREGGVKGAWGGGGWVEKNCMISTTLLMLLKTILGAVSSLFLYVSYK